MKPKIWMNNGRKTDDKNKEISWLRNGTFISQYNTYVTDVPRK